MMDSKVALYNGDPIMQSIIDVLWHLVHGTNCLINIRSSMVLIIVYSIKNIQEHFFTNKKSKCCIH